MRKKVFQHAGALIIAAIILTFFTMSWAMYNNTAEQLRVSVRNECEYYRYFLDKMGDDSLDKPAGKITASRVTLIDTDGTVLFDSVEDENMMGNHSGRPEVIEAEKTGESNISRYSETLRSKTYYTALRLDNGKIIRVSLTTDSVFGVMLRNIWLVAVLIAAVLVVELMMVSHMTKALVKPINEIDLNHPLDNKAYEELSPLLGRIHQQQKQIQQQMEELRHNQEEYLAITEYMKDGLIVTNQSVVLSINRSAQNLFDVTAEECINHNIVTVSSNEQLAACAVSVEGTYDPVVSLADLRHFDSLQVLSVNNRRGAPLITDLTGLEECKNLMLLSVPSVESSAFPTFAKLDSVVKLEYGSDGIRADSNVSDLSALAQMKSLKMLRITGSEVDLAQLAGADLRVLRLDVTRIGSLEPLKQMENLSFLQLYQGPEIDSFAPLAESSVQYLSMSLSQGAQETYKDMDYTPLTQMPQLIWLDLTNNITFDTETCKKLLANDTALKYLKISYTSAAKDAEELDTAHLKEFTAPAP